MNLPKVNDRIQSDWAFDGVMVWWPGQVISCKKSKSGDLMIYKVKYDALPWMNAGSSIERHIFYGNGTLFDLQTKKRLICCFKSDPR